ncbi:YbhB/YbcL family Raf kinase inhibitor-like protein [Acidiferrimicrobium sp. IK]|uniref:YbhB/YbcL family Raf kinase inhibitor-like protein n=1 Tax=Acidiferrimicrobium sp. IK TaxID=2871700 RepID=UPI0021CB6B52|nr:YbhB/YbcL family Raf kinase inhibitor-like protein [Acidiferrimicrobium sp. IK]MCU4186328.1 YbhB/YbcL family Raf kinase inhibitor-like protein [Acidiferrimicrobium sp. IK]
MLDRPLGPDPYDLLPALPGFEVTSEDLTDGGTLPLDHVFSDAGGGNVSPHLAWSGFPEDTAGFAVTCFDPDAPTASGFWHWSVVGLGSWVTELPRGAGAGGEVAVAGGGFQVRNDFGRRGYDGAAPPNGDRPHRYVFAVHALGVSDLGLSPEATPAYVGFNLTLNALARARITALYQVE